MSHGQAENVSLAFGVGWTLTPPPSPSFADSLMLLLPWARASWPGWAGLGPDSQFTRNPNNNPTPRPTGPLRLFLTADPHGRGSLSQPLDQLCPYPLEVGTGVLGSRQEGALRERHLWLCVPSHAPAQRSVCPLSVGWMSPWQVHSPGPGHRLTCVQGGQAMTWP